MIKISPMRAACALVLSFGIAGAAVAGSADVDKVMSQGGLQKTKVKGIALAYVRPGATLASYKRVMIEPVEVAFDRNWKPERAGGRFKLSDEQKEEIRSGAARFVREEFTKELEGKGNYKVTTEAGPDVLRVKLNIIDLFINAPDAGGPGRVKTYSPEAGNATLIAELSDSSSKQLLARIADRREVGADRLQMSGKGVNEADFRAVAATWASVMRKALDNAQGIGK